MKHDTPSKLKFQRLKRELGLPHYQVVGILESLWILAANNCPDGNLSHLSAGDIAEFIEYKGNPERLLRALVQDGTRGWIDEFNGQLQIHDWLVHCPDFIKKRAKRSKTQNTDTTDLRGVLSGHVRTCPEMSGITQPNPTQPNPTEQNLTEPNPTQPKEKPQSAKQGSAPGVVGASARAHEWFKVFWDSWPRHPRKTNRKGCLAKIKALAKREKSPEELEELLQQIAQGLDAWKKSQQWAKEGGQYIPAPMTWINQERWADEVVDFADSRTITQDEDEFEPVPEPSIEQLRRVFG